MALYSDVIRERFRRPRFRGAVERPDVSHEDVNPLCGDRVRIQGRLAGGRLAEARWTGDCCAICAASADLLVEAARGQPVGFARALTPSSLLERLDSDIRPSRMRCVTLPLTVLQDALSGHEATR
ncbi:MAG: iron-sulfur cluster assembly scaffold protein [Candidatus Rokuibacteriota bacterium]